MAAWCGTQALTAHDKLCSDQHWASHLIPMQGPKASDQIHKTTGQHLYMISKKHQQPFSSEMPQGNSLVIRKADIL